MDDNAKQNHYCALKELQVSNPGFTVSPRGWKTAIGTFIVSATVLGCASNWNYDQPGKRVSDQDAPDAQICKQCHEHEYESWEKTAHADASRMKKLPGGSSFECGICHDNLVPHSDNPYDTKPSISSGLDKNEQNTTCGTCHFSKNMMGKEAFNPYYRHGLFMSVGFIGKKDTISCLDCHGGHSGKSQMLQRSKAHICFSCHKEAVVTMAFFQPFNYLSAGHACIGCHPQHGSPAGEHSTRVATGAAISCYVCHPTGIE